MENLSKKNDVEIVELSLTEMVSIDGGIERWHVVAALMLGGPIGGAFALGYYNATH